MKEEACVLDALVDNGVFLSFDDMIVMIVLIRRCCVAFFLLSGIACCVLVDIRRTLCSFSAAFLRWDRTILAIPS